jgi:hypothetical protein
MRKKSPHLHASSSSNVAVREGLTRAVHGARPAGRRRRYQTAVLPFGRTLSRVLTHSLS